MRHALASAMIEPQRLQQAVKGRHGARVMIVEDDEDIATLVSNVLAEEGYATTIVTDSRQAIETFQRVHPDVVTLDVMMPSIDGISLCLELRRTSEVPILFISARKDPPDRVVGLRIGADDYMSKPFDTEELVARVDALLRRSAMSHDGGDRQIRFGRFVIDLSSVQAVEGEQQVQLTPTEFKLLRTLAAEPARVFTRDDLLTGVWGYGEPGSDTRLVDVHVGRLRKKLDDAKVSEVQIETARGFGYRLVDATRPSPRP